MGIFTSLNLNNGIMGNGVTLGAESMKLESNKIKAGAYICTILDAQEIEVPWGKQLEIMLDIVDGEYKDYYRNEYNSNKFLNPKYKGFLKLNLPSDAGASASRDLMIINNFFEAVLKSNEGFKLDDSTEFTDLKGCEVGIVFREEAYYFNQREGVTVKPYCAISTQRVKDNDYIIPDRKPLSEQQRRQKQADATLLKTEQDESDWPF